MAVSVLKVAQDARLLPKQIIYYRDGVSEGQFEQVKNLEVKQLRAAIKKVFAPPYDAPGISCIIAKKRHHTRFFYENSDRNVGPGRMPVPVITASTATVPWTWMRECGCAFLLIVTCGGQGRSPKDIIAQNVIMSCNALRMAVITVHCTSSCYVWGQDCYAVASSFLAGSGYLSMWAFDIGQLRMASMSLVWKGLSYDSASCVLIHYSTLQVCWWTRKSATHFSMTSS